MRPWREIVENSGARLFAGVANLAVLFVTARALGPEGRGEIAVAVTWATLMATIAGLSLGQVSHRHIQDRRGDDWLPNLVGTMLVLAIGASVAALLGAWAISAAGMDALPNSLSRTVVLVACVLVPLLVLDEYARNLLAAVGRMRSFAAAQVVGNLLRIVLVIAAVGPLRSGVAGVVVAIVVSQWVIVGIEGRVLWQAAGRRIAFSKPQAARFFGDSLRLHLNTVASFLLVQSNVLLLDHLATPADVGNYQLAQQLVLVVVLLPQSASMVLFGRIAERGADAAWPDQKRLMAQVLAAVLAIGIIAYAVAPWFVQVFAGDEFYSAPAVMRCLLPALLGMSLAEMMAPQWFARGIFLTSTVLTCITALASIVLNAYLIQRNGVMGAAWGTAIVYLAIVVVGQFAFAAWCESQYRRRAATQPGSART
jgi:enterobacterial common antigen flippase